MQQISSMNIYLTIITENQTQKIQAEQLAAFVQTALGADWYIENIDSYYKFDHSYKIALKIVVNGMTRSEIFQLAITQTDQLVSPWLLYFDQFENTIELIFNKNENTKSVHPAFDAIHWAHLQMAE
jgi:hypothetical protein